MKEESFVEAKNGGKHMGCWGMGITQSDEYCEVYDRFMEEYDCGRPVPDITAQILEEYLTEFAPDDGVLHDVYFALGKCQWMCGGISSEILEQISTIIRSGTNLAFYRELGADEKELKQRQKNLERFWAGLQTPRETVRKHKVSEETYAASPKPATKSFPALHACNVAAYPYGDRKRLLLVVDFMHHYKYGKMAFCLVWYQDFGQLPTMEALMDAPVAPLGWISGSVFPEEWSVVGDIYVSKSLLWHMAPVFPMWQVAPNAVVTHANLYEDFPAHLFLPLKEVTEKVDQHINRLRLLSGDMCL